MANFIEVAIASFTTSFIFGLGGLGAAVALIPILMFLGVPFPLARPAGLFTNFISTSSVTAYNFKENIVDLKLALPIVVTSVFTSPIGAYCSHIFPERIVGIAFTVFLFFAGVMVYIPKKEIFKERFLTALPPFTGALAGFISGFLGVGGGGIISPILVLAGYNPKKVTSITAFTVPFSSLAGFFTYWKIGNVDWIITLFAAIPSAVAGYFSAYISHNYMKPSQIKKLLGIVFFILGVKFLTKFA